MQPNSQPSCTDPPEQPPIHQAGQPEEPEPPIDQAGQPESASIGGLILTRIVTRTSDGIGGESGGESPSSVCNNNPDVLYSDTDSDQDEWGHRGGSTLGYFKQSGQVWHWPQPESGSDLEKTHNKFVMLSAGSPSSSQADHHLSQQDRGAAEIDYCDQEPGAMMICP